MSLTKPNNNTNTNNTNTNNNTINININNRRRRDTGHHGFESDDFNSFSGSSSHRSHNYNHNHTTIRYQQRQIESFDTDDEHEHEPCLGVADLEVKQLHHASLQLPRNDSRSQRTSFPPDTLAVVRLLDGNSHCVDCAGYDFVDGVLCEPMYASVAYGTLLCKRCALGHFERASEHNNDNNNRNRNRSRRNLNQTINKLSSTTHHIKELMQDTWSLREIITLLEGGNRKFKNYCRTTKAYPRHATPQNSNKNGFITALYKSKTVQTYQEMLKEETEFTISNKWQLGPRPRYKHPPDDIYMMPQDPSKYSRTLPMMNMFEFFIMEIGGSLDEIEQMVQEQQQQQQQQQQQTKAANEAAKNNNDNIPPQNYRKSTNYVGLRRNDSIKSEFSTSTQTARDAFERLQSLDSDSDSSGSSAKNNDSLSSIEQPFHDDEMNQFLGQNANIQLSMSDDEDFDALAMDTEDDDLDDRNGGVEQRLKKQGSLRKRSKRKKNLSPFGGISRSALVESPPPGPETEDDYGHGETATICKSQPNGRPDAFLGIKWINRLQRINSQLEGGDSEKSQHNNQIQQQQRQQRQKIVEADQKRDESSDNLKTKDDNTSITLPIISWINSFQRRSDLERETHNRREKYKAKAKDLDDDEKATDSIPCNVSSRSTYAMRQSEVFKAINHVPAPGEPTMIETAYSTDDDDEESLISDYSSLNSLAALRMEYTLPLKDKALTQHDSAEGGRGNDCPDILERVRQDSAGSNPQSGNFHKSGPKIHISAPVSDSSTSSEDLRLLESMFGGSNLSLLSNQQESVASKGSIGTLQRRQRMRRESSHGVESTNNGVSGGSVKSANSSGYKVLMRASYNAHLQSFSDHSSSSGSQSKDTSHQGYMDGIKNIETNARKPHPRSMLLKPRDHSGELFVNIPDAKPLRARNPQLDPRRRSFNSIAPRAVAGGGGEKNQIKKKYVRELKKNTLNTTSSPMPGIMKKADSMPRRSLQSSLETAKMLRTTPARVKSDSEVVMMTAGSNAQETTNQPKLSMMHASSTSRQLVTKKRVTISSASTQGNIHPVNRPVMQKVVSLKNVSSPRGKTV